MPGKELQLEPSERQESSPSSTELPLDALQNELGAFGLYQFLLLLLMAVSKVPLGYNQLLIIFVAPKTKYTCSNGEADKCPCDNPVYDTSVFPKTLITEYDLICEKRWMYDVTQSLFQFGTLTGSMAFGWASDRFGRRYSFLAAIGVLICGGFGSWLIRNFWVFTLMRYVVGCASGGVIIASFVHMMEYTGAKCRETITLVFMTTFVIGVMTLPIIAYFVRSYDNFLLTIAIINCLALCYICLLPETPRWLLTQNQTEKAIKLFNTVAKRNKHTEVDIRGRVEQHLARIAREEGSSGAAQKGTLLDIFRRSNMRRNLIIMAYDWFTGSFCYYGLSQYMGQLPGNVFVNSGASGIVTLIGLIAGIPITNIVGRKKITVVTNLLAALCILLTIWLPSGLPVVICACIGVSANFFVFSVEFLYCVELFPTVVRSSGMGFCSMAARIGSMAAPFVVGLEQNVQWLPKVIFGASPLVAAGLSLFLPETKGLGLASTMEEGEAIGKKSSE